MHQLQRKLVDLSNNIDLSKLTLRDIGEKIGVGRDNPQKTKHHLQQLVKKGLFKNDNGKYFKLDIEIENRRSNLVSLPIFGSANCGEAISFADDSVEGYLKMSPSLLKNRENVFVVKAKGDSMNKASVDGLSINDGDYVLIDASNKNPEDGDYVLSVIDGLANIKKIKIDRDRGIFILLSE